MKLLASRLEIDQTFAKGVVVGLGLPMQKIGTCLAITEDQFVQVKQHLRKTKYPDGGRAHSRRPLVAESA